VELTDEAKEHGLAEAAKKRTRTASCHAGSTLKTRLGSGVNRFPGSLLPAKGVGSRQVLMHNLNIGVSRQKNKPGAITGKKKPIDLIGFFAD